MTRDVYDKIFFKENYSAEMRERSMVRESANPRANASDMPNATTVVFMEDTPNGGVTITTGDFVAYFNKQYGCDRVGNMRRTLADAQRNCELKRAKAQQMAEAESRKATSKKKQVTEHHRVRPRFSLVKAVFGLMLVLAIAVLVGTSLLLEQTELELATLRSEVEEMQAAKGTQVKMEMNAAAPQAYALDGEQSVEIYEPQEESSMMSEVFSAISNFWKS